ncbi:hypothetical protein L5515_012515 [Caenorhabditis briggsae]|uniref:Uncharacterized protein n=1 Tax=Caenorhabditis briggsae TaxID=6238 RepID=A0AAE9EST2_CAEBR|nr:hypothetical protein L5515_012515 [Caenorhabditis briggsae]
MEIMASRNGAVPIKRSVLNPEYSPDMMYNIEYYKVKSIGRREETPCLLEKCGACQGVPPGCPLYKESYSADLHYSIVLPLPNGWLLIFHRPNPLKTLQNGPVTESGPFEVCILSIFLNILFLLIYFKLKKGNHGECSLHYSYKADSAKIVRVKNLDVTMRIVIAVQILVTIIVCPKSCALKKAGCKNQVFEEYR